MRDYGWFSVGMNQGIQLVQVRNESHDYGLKGMRRIIGLTARKEKSWLNFEKVCAAEAI